MAIGAIDIGGTKTITGILNDSGEVLISRNFLTESKDWKVHFQHVADVFKECQREYHDLISKTPLIGVGITMPGMTDAENGILMYAPHQNWRDVLAREFFKKALEMESVFIENDVNACAIGEMIFAKGGSDFLWLTISTGNGGALVSNAQLVRGFGNCAGEFGHVKVEYDHPRLCACGQRGCLESQSSGTAIAELFNEKIKIDEMFQAEVNRIEQTNPNFLRDASGLALMANQGNQFALETYRNVGKYLGRAIAYGLNISNPEKVFLGGGVVRSLDLFLPALINEIKRSVVPVAQNVQILETNLGYHAALKGAGALVKINLPEQFIF